MPVAQPMNGAGAGAGAPGGPSRVLQDQFEAQTARLREIYKAKRPKNTARTYEPKQKEWEDWCARLEGNTDGSRVTEDKLCLFLEQEVINRESRASGYQARKTKRKEVWKEGDRAKKRQKTAVEEEEKWDEHAHEAMAKLRHEAVIAAIDSIAEIVRPILDRLDKMERSSASGAS